MENLDDKRIDCIFDMINSLNSSVYEAGGNELKLDKLKELTVYNMIKLLAPNGIRFTFDKNKIVK